MDNAMRVLVGFLTPWLLWGATYLPPAPNCASQLTSLEEKDFFCSLDFLYWESIERGLDYALKNQHTQSTQDLSVYAPHMQWEPAFRVGLGVHLPWDHWDLACTYTFFQTEAENGVDHIFNTSSTPGPGLLAVWVCPTAFAGNGVGVRFGRATADWKLRSQFLDCALSRAFYLSSHLSIQPGFGGRIAWIHQHYDLSYSSGNTIASGLGNLASVLSSDIQMINFSNNFGPFFSCSSRFRFGGGWDLFGSVSGALLASRFHVGRKESDFYLNTSSGLQQEYVRLKHSYWIFTPQGSLALGIRFGECVAMPQKTLYYSLSASYETQIFWKQNQLLQYIDSFSASALTASVAPTQGDLFLHGLTLNFQLDF